MTMVLKQQLNEGCGGLGGLGDGVWTGNCASMAVKPWISSCVYSCGDRRKACLDAIMLGLSLARLLGVQPCQHGWRAGGLTQPAPRSSGRETVS